MTYIKLSRAPEWVIQYPQCSACMVDLEIDDQWTCPVCGTTWPSNANDGDVGELTCEPLGGPTLSDHEAMLAGIAFERAVRDRLLARTGIRP